MAEVIVVGAGISGLAAASFLRQHHNVTLLESSASPGGKLGTDQIDGRLVNRAANGWLSGEPAMDDLIQLLGLEDEILPVSDQASQRWIYADGRLHQVPMHPLAILKSPLLSPLARLRLLIEPFIGRSRDREETLAGFIARRLGKEAVTRLIAPMVAGIHAADPAKLSLRATFPKLHDMENKHRSLILALLKRPQATGPRPQLTSLNHGIGQLIDTMTQHLSGHIHCSTTVNAIEQRQTHWVVHTDGGAQQADAVLLTCPAYAQATIVRSLNPELAETLDAIPYAPVVVVASAWPRGAWNHQPRGFGALVAGGEDLGGVLGTLYTSCTFPNHSRDDEVLLRTFIGGSIHPEVTKLDDATLLQRTRMALGHFFDGERAEPTLYRVYRHPRGIPQYTVGHLGRTNTIASASARYPGLFFIGNHLNGVGVKDCVRNASSTSQTICEWFERRV